MKLPTISLVTPSYNQGEYIEETIVSVLSQDFPEIEYMVVDGGSTDGTVDILRKYESDLAWWVSERDRGQSHAINKGLRRSTGEILGYLNSDDTLTEGTLWKVAEAFREHPRDDLIVSWAGEVHGAREERILPPADPRLTTWLRTTYCLLQPSTFWSRALYERAGGFREDLHFCFDKEFFLKCIFDLGTYEARRDWVAARFRVHDASKTSRLQDLNRHENEMLWEEFRNRPPYDRRLRKEQRQEQARVAIGDALDQGAGPAARKLARLALRSPDQVVTRMYAGAWRRVLQKWVGRDG